MKKPGAWTCLLCLFFLTTVCVAAAGHSQTSEEQQKIELLLGFEQIPLEESQGLLSGFADSIASGLSRAASGASEAFWGALQRFSIARHAFYSAVLDHITGAVDQILPPSASLRFRTSFGNYGAAEPASIPEPPTISSKSGLRLKMFGIWHQVLQDYRSTAVDSPPEGISCRHVAKQHLHLLQKMFKTQLQTSLCGFNFKRGCTHKFCKLLSHDSNAAVDKVFQILGVNKHEVVHDHVANSLACTHSAQFQSGTEMTEESHIEDESRLVIPSLLGAESYSARMMRFATSPSRLFMSFYSSRPRPSFYYRRAMIFRNANEPQVSLEFYIFRNGVEESVKNNPLPEPGISEMHSVPLLPQGFLKPEEPENAPEDSSVIKMNTGNGAAAAL